MRGIAATLVVVYHSFLFVGGRYPGVTEAYGDVGGYVISGSAAAIFLFFALSGYLLGRPYVRSFILQRPNPRLGDFARNRVARIVPACWAALTVTLIVRGVGDSSFLEVTATYALVQNWVPSEAQVNVIHIWSVDAEAAFYASLPIAGALGAWLQRARGDRQTRLMLLLGLLAACVAFSFAWRARHPLDLTWQRHVPGVLFAIAVGMALAALEIGFVDRARRLRRPALIAAGLFALGWLVLLGFAGAGQAGSLRRSVVVAVACTLIMGGPLLRQVAGGGCSRLLDNRVMRAVGRWSYSIYLFHLVVLHQVATRVDQDSAWGDAGVVVPVTVVLSIALGALSFQLIEKPCMRFRGVSSQPSAPPRG